ncbi:MAG: hypothetical protein CMC04_11130 [Flavobacteriaceae bacterium]|jgi:hypothetical protein|nr:hypothetical protein [Flavobacteriaceae bacterium]|tara:strand:- start:14008 stop:14721 length:714 start_codon:yes stop_codon:yes gene_type:complete
MKYIISLFLFSNFFYSQNQIKPNEKEVWDPEPKVVDPFYFNGIPSDAIILFDGNDFSKWKSIRSDQKVLWTLNIDKSMTVKPGTGGISTRDEHGSIQLHIEWKTPKIIKGEGQYRGNSGVFFQRRYEVQILDSYNNRTYSNGQAGSIYLQHVPLVNATLPPDTWQTYDIIFNAPEFNEGGKKIKNGSFIVFHNGVLIQNAVEIISPTLDVEDSTPYSLFLQDHGNLVSYKNIWMRKI